MKYSIIILVFLFFIQYSSFAQLTVSEKDGKYGYIDKHGNVKIPYIYNEAWNFNYPGYAYVQKEKKEYLIDTLGTEYRLAYNNIDSLSEETRALDLSCSHLVEIPKRVFMFPLLEILFLDDANMHAITTLGGIKSLPSEIGTLTNLLVLKLEKNSIKEIPTEIENLIKLQILDFGSNQLDTVVSEIGELTSLTHLNLNGNNLTFLPPEIGNLENLIFLGLNQNMLTSLPYEIGKLKNLEFIYLGMRKNSSEKFRLPSEFWNLSKLKRLDLNTCLIEELPSEIKNLTELTFLNLEINKLSKLPIEIGALNKLEVLYLYGNLLTVVPKEIGNLTNLKQLDLSRNKLTFLPKEMANLTNLKSLYLIDNNFSETEKEKVRKILPKCKVVFENL